MKNASRAIECMSTPELATVLCTLLAKHPDLRDEAEAIAMAMFATVSVEDVASDVCDAVSSLDIQSFHGRAGKQPWGYMEPTAAARKLLEEAVEGFFADMKRCMDLALKEAAEATCCGIVLGLHRAKSIGAGSDGPLGWAVDFPDEEACHAVAELIRAYPANERSAARDRLVETLGGLVPEWDWMLAKSADSAANS